MPTTVLRTHNQGTPKTLPQSSVGTRTQNSVSATKETSAAYRDGEKSKNHPKKSGKVSQKILHLNRILYVFINLFNRYVLNEHYVPGGTAADKADTASALRMTQ